MQKTPHKLFGSVRVLAKRNLLMILDKSSAY